MIFRRLIYSIFLIFLAFQFSLQSEKKLSEEWTVKEADIRFLSEAPQETIRGALQKAEGNADLRSKKFSFQVNLNNLNVPNRLMNRHMHENYLETENFPYATFQGNILKWDLTSKTVIVEGDFTLHGITKRTFGCKVTLKKKEKIF